MKYFRILFLSILPLALGFMFSCDDHGDPQGPINLTPGQEATVGMRGLWGIASDASLPFGTTEGVLDDLLMDFRIDDSYNTSTYSASGADYFFATEDGTWSWTDDSYSRISLSNGPIGEVEVMKEGISIRLTFQYDDPLGGRVSGVGEYGVTLTKISP